LTTQVGLLKSSWPDEIRIGRDEMNTRYALELK